MFNTYLLILNDSFLAILLMNVNRSIFVKDNSRVRRYGVDKVCKYNKQKIILHTDIRITTRSKYTASQH